jgi:hypothetical protein
MLDALATGGIPGNGCEGVEERVRRTGGDAVFDVGAEGVGVDDALDETPVTGVTTSARGVDFVSPSAHAMSVSVRVVTATDTVIDRRCIRVNRRPVVTTLPFRRGTTPTVAAESLNFVQEVVRGGGVSRPAASCRPVSPTR